VGGGGSSCGQGKGDGGKKNGGWGSCTTFIEQGWGGVLFRYPDMEKKLGAREKYHLPPGREEGERGGEGIPVNKVGKIFKNQQHKQVRKHLNG